MAAKKDNTQVRIAAAFIVGVVSCVLALTWFGWHLLLVLVLFVWGNNLSRTAD